MTANNSEDLLKESCVLEQFNESHIEQLINIRNNSEKYFETFKEILKDFKRMMIFLYCAMTVNLCFCVVEIINHEYLTSIIFAASFIVLTLTLIKTIIERKKCKNVIAMCEKLI
jgi:hypothetical protein